jgi:phenylacetate-CoA ligase
MQIGVLTEMERLARSVAHDAIYRRRGLSGWKAKRDDFLRSLRKDPEAIRSDVDERLRNVVTHAFDTVPYYRQAWKAAGVDPSLFRQARDLEHLPCVNKEVIRERKAELVSDRYEEDMLDMDHTSGTTGTHTIFYRDHDCTLSRVGRQWGILGLCGYRPGMKRALVWGVNSDLSAGRTRRGIKRWLRDFGGSQEALPCAVMTEADLISYHRRLTAFKPEVLYGYPSAIEQVARFIRESGLPPIRVKTIITTAERLTVLQRNLFEQLFGGEVFNLYNTREYGCVGFECGEHDGFHIDTESAFIEITREGKPVPVGQIGEITITDLLNRGMPFIRSRTGDMGSLSRVPCACGSPLPVLKALDGRVTDVLYRADGSAVPGVLLLDHFADTPGIKAVQFIQEQLKQVDVLLVADQGYSRSLAEDGLRRFQTVMGADTKIRMLHVPEIARNPNSGKFQDVICKLNAEELRACRRPLAV